MAFKKRNIPWNKGKKGTKSYLRTKEHKKKMSMMLKGRKFKKKHRENLSKAQKIAVSRRWNSQWGEIKKKEFKIKYKGKNNPMYGKKRPDLSERNRINIRTLKNHWNWQGGITKENFKLRGIKKTLLWRIHILERDAYTCQVCLKVGIKLHVHHIKSWAKYPENRWDTDNGITLCEECHRMTY